VKCAGILDLNTSWYVAVTAKDLLHTGMLSFLPNDSYCIKYVKILGYTFFKSSCLLCSLLGTA